MLRSTLGFIVILICSALCFALPAVLLARRAWQYGPFGKAAVLCLAACLCAAAAVCLAPDDEALFHTDERLVAFLAVSFVLLMVWASALFAAHFIHRMVKGRAYIAQPRTQGARRQ